MAEYGTPKYGVAFEFDIALVSQADTKLLKANPTLAAGDVKVSKDNGAFSNITTLPTVSPAAGVNVRVQLSATEMQAEKITVAFVDAAGAEWCDVLVSVRTNSRNLADLAIPGSAMTLSNNAITTASINDGAFTAAKFASDFFGAIWSYAVASITTAGSIGKRIVDYLTGDIYTLIGPTGSGLTSLAPAATALSTAQWTNARATYLDNLNIGGPAASQADVTAINQSASRRLILTVPMQMERPEAGSTTYWIVARTYSRDGAAMDAVPDPTLYVEGVDSGDLTANLSLLSHSATGVYIYEYEVANNAAIEQLLWTFDATVEGDAVDITAVSTVCDFVAATFTTADRTALLAAQAAAEAAEAQTTPAAIRGAVGLGAANLDAQLGDIFNAVDFLPGMVELAGPTMRWTDLALSGVANVLDSRLDALDDDFDTALAVLAKVNTTLVLDGVVYQFTANALELAPSGGGGLTEPVDCNLVLVNGSPFLLSDLTFNVLDYYPKLLNTIPARLVVGTDYTEVLGNPITLEDNTLPDLNDYPAAKLTITSLVDGTKLLDAEDAVTIDIGGKKIYWECSVPAETLASDEWQATVVLIHTGGGVRAWSKSRIITVGV